MKQLTDEQAAALAEVVEWLFANVQDSCGCPGCQLVRKFPAGILDALTTPAPCPVPEGYERVECPSVGGLIQGDLVMGMVYSFSGAWHRLDAIALNAPILKAIIRHNPVYRPIPEPEPDTAAKIADAFDALFKDLSKTQIRSFSESIQAAEGQHLVARLRKLGEGQS